MSLQQSLTICQRYCCQYAVLMEWKRDNVPPTRQQYLTNEKLFAILDIQSVIYQHKSNYCFCVWINHMDDEYFFAPCTRTTSFISSPLTDVTFPKLKQHWSLINWSISSLMRMHLTLHKETISPKLSDIVFPKLQQWWSIDQLVPFTRDEIDKSWQDLNRFGSRPARPGHVCLMDPYCWCSLPADLPILCLAWVALFMLQMLSR